MLNTIPFAVGSTQVQKDVEPMLREIVETLAHHPSMTLEVDGHADATEGTDPARLATDRAEHVRSALVGLGVDGTRLQAVGCGTGAHDSRYVSFPVHLREEGQCAR
jgi:outer membrane protein OmpA-like peptidoglycan-associated protein